MTAGVRILCGPAGSGKTGQLLGRLHAWARRAPGSALWLGPARRGVEDSRGRVLQGLPGLWGFRLCTFHDLGEEILREEDPLARTLSDVQRRLVVEEVVADLHEAGQLSHFARVLDTRGFTEGLLGLLAELERSGVTPAAFARAAYRRGATARPGKQINGRAIGLKDRQLARIYARYRQELRRQGLLDAAGRVARACDLLRRGAAGPFGGTRAVFVDGFADFTPAQYELLEALRGRVEEMWITLPDEPGDVRAELFARPRATLERLRRWQPEVSYGEAGGGCEPPDGSHQGAHAPRPPASQPLGRPAGLVHLERQLFRPLRSVVPSDDAAGVSCIEAPGVLGELRLVARAIKGLLLGGVPAEHVLVTLRDVGPAADLLREVFDEYGIPVEVEGAEPLLRSPAVAALLRAVRLPDDDWPFAGVTALLRNNYFRPPWPETADCPEVPRHAEALLRLLGEPRDRDAYLSAVRRWAESQQAGLEDEQAEESRRRHTHELAGQCRPFLEHFFCAWDGAPAHGTPADHVAWLRDFAEDVGVSAAAAEDVRDAAALGLLWDELDKWERREARRVLRDGRRTLDRKTFLRRLSALAGAAGLARTPRAPGRVRVLSADQARHLEAPYLFVLGLGERSFPRLTPLPSLLDDQDRQGFREAKLPLAGGDALPDEMLLFYQVVTRARRQLVLSYPAVDERGVGLLPSSFLLAVLDCFGPGAVPVERRRMLIEGFDRDVPLSPAEYRVRLAASWGEGAASGAGLPEDLRANLAGAAELVHRRFRDREYNPYDGLLRDPAVVGELQRLFGPERVFSPTALEDYVACPFRFFLRHVLHLEPLEGPREEIEVTRRGQAFHRALARLHRNLKEAGVHRPGAEASEQVLQEIRTAVEEDVRRAPSPASKELWRLEGQRLVRIAGRYGAQWQKFLGPWQERGVAPRPHFFEVDFGLPAAEGEVPHGPLVIRAGDTEVRVSGRIDRVDLAELPDGVGFWVIDYKTGRSSHYTSSDLAEYRRLQLTLYALAVEEVLLAGEKARPLGLAYWLVGEGGPKVVLPVRNQVLWLEETQRWRAVREQLLGWVTALVENIRRGAFPLAPRSEHCTQTCPFAQVCRITQARAVGKTWSLPLPAP